MKRYGGTSLVVQWLGLYSSTACSTGLIPGWGTKILYAVGAECPPPPRKEVIHIYTYIYKFTCTKR